MAIIFVGMETSGALRRRFQALGYEAYSCDLLPSEDGAEAETPMGHHIVGDVFDVLDDLRAQGRWPSFAIFHPDCTYLTNSAEWAFKDADFERYPGVGYHQRVKPGTLVGAARRQARGEALDLVRRIFALKMPKIVENPKGAIGTAIAKAMQIVQPYQLGDDASKGTCLWGFDADGEPIDMRLTIDPALYVPPTLRANGKYYWSNQTDTGQNRLSPGDDRWKDRSRTYPGIADALVARVHQYLEGSLT